MEDEVATDAKKPPASLLSVSRAFRVKEIRCKKTRLPLRCDVCRRLRPGETEEYRGFGTEED